ncbi:hypothetical protein MSAN_02033300 [Mycena sanguinolenta]|uniref:Uncharacterized protein n=1 Tax=Mycena sanguinolenta TaxID=230812 RepID=A0A8H7CMT5_9AGAR|nr:hypothetical protein MSAN_02033300 [Mycena sanguinolenta]
MHKEMNLVKGGVQAMKLFWESIGGPAPIKLMNKANDAAAANSAPGSKASEHALAASEGGAVKVTSLVGALFNHKDDKKGQQDTFKLYFESFLGYTISCPDTSNTRFQSHCDCAIFIIVYLTKILEFMTFIMYSKESPGLNHLEQNILKKLKCTSTLTELAVLALYANAVSYPYMRVVRGMAADGTRPNAMDLGPLHAKVILFCESIAANPDLLLTPDASFKTGSLDGQLWEHGDVFYGRQTPGRASEKSIKKTVSSQGCLRRREPRSTSIPRMTTTKEDSEAYVEQCESALVSLSVHNAKSKYKVNGTMEFLRSNDAVTSALRIWLRKEARRRIDSGRDRKRRIELIERKQLAVDAKQEAETARKAKDEARKAELANLTPILDDDWIEANHNTITVPEVVKHINWHRQFVEKGVIPKKTLITAMSKTDKVRQWITALTRFNQEILPKLQFLKAAALTAGLLDADIPAAEPSIPFVDNWDALDELNDEDLMDEY